MSWLLRPKIILPFVAMLALIGVAVRQMQPPQVRAAEAGTGRVVEVVYATGTVKPDTETKVAAEVSARIVALTVDEGDVVTAGQVIARLDDTDARTRLREAENRLQTAQAKLRQAAAPTDPFVLSQLQAQLSAADSRLRATQERSRSSANHVSTLQNSVRAAQSGVESAKAKIRAFRNSARAAQNEVESARERVTAAQADVVQARANVDAAKDLYRRRVQLLRDGAIAERQVTEARTALAAVEAAVNAAQSRVQSAEQAVTTAKANAEAAQAQADDAQAGLDTAQANAAAAASQVREAEDTVADLRRQAEAAAHDAEAIRSQIGQARRGQRESDIAPSRTEVGTQEAAVAQAREELEKYTVRSPVAGRVTSRPVDPGDYAPSGTRLLSVANEQKIYVQADVDEADIGMVRVGHEVRFQVDAQPGRTYVGRVTLVGHAADRSTKTYPVEVRQLDRAEGLRIGMTTDVNIQGRVTESAVVLPSAALVTEKDHTYVWTIDSENRVRRVPVKIKARDANTVQVLEGLAPRQRTVLNPASGLQEGQRVRVQP